MRGGKYLAEERGAFDQTDAGGIASEPEVETPAATAPLFEIAAAHDGQPAGPWLQMFYDAYGRG